MLRQLLLVPSLACPASCGYCFGPHEGGPPMRQDTVEAIVRWLNAFGNNTLDITFHGGEPLVPGVRFYRMALPLLREGLAPRRVRFSIQSNLWFLTDELCELFREHGVSVGTSLDGPEPINDAQRGRGYFQRTMAGIERAREHGISVGCICTFTAQSAPHAEEIFDFFVHEGLNFAIHAALPSLQYPQANGWTLSPEVHGELLVNMLEHYLANMDKVRIGTLDSMIRSVSAQRGGTCTFGDCLGSYLAIGPEGGIYSCQRFAGMPEYQKGNVHDCPSIDALSATPTWRMFKDRQDRIVEECGDCPNLDFCRGGCPYNVLAANGRSFSRMLRDSHCPAYRRVFDYIVDQAMEEVFSKENLDAVVNRADPEAGLLQRGRLLTIMRDGPHPHETAQHTRRILAAVALAATDSSTEATRRLQGIGLVTNFERTEAAMKALHEHLTARTTGPDNFLCPFRYLCGGACPAWNRQPEQEQADLDAPSMDCSLLYRRSRSLLVSALEHLGVSVERWLAASLPLPASPPSVKQV